MTDLAKQADQLRWYHTIELPGGVVTKGLFDLRGLPEKIPIPQSLAGQRCLDIGTCDGFWAFELERRGAAEVVAIDLGDPSKRDLTVAVKKTRATSASKDTFALAHEVLGSKVAFRDCSVYDLNSGDFGEFDFVFMGSLLLHLRDPVLALTAVRTVAKGQFLSYDSISPMMTVLAPRTPAAKLHGNLRQEWWIPNTAGRKRELEAGGFEVLDSGRVSWVKRRGASRRVWTYRKRPFSAAMLAYLGVPHTWVLARRSTTAN